MGTFFFLTSFAVGQESPTAGLCTGICGLLGSRPHSWSVDPTVNFMLRGLGCVFLLLPPKKSVEKSSSTKLVPGAKKIGGCCSRRFKKYWLDGKSWTKHILYMIWTSFLEKKRKEDICHVSRNQDNVCNMNIWQISNHCPLWTTV